MVDDPRLTARSMIEQDETDVDELWLRYFANGGNAQPLEFEAMLYGLCEVNALELDLLRFTLEELQSPRKPADPFH